MKTPSKIALFGVRKKLRKLLEMSRQDYDDSLLEAANLRSTIRRLKTENQALRILAKDAANAKPSLDQVKKFIANCSEDDFFDLNHNAFIPKGIEFIKLDYSPLSNMIKEFFPEHFGSTVTYDKIKTASDADLLTLCKRLEAIPICRRTPKMQQALEACSKELLSR